MCHTFCAQLVHWIDKCNKSPVPQESVCYLFVIHSVPSVCLLNRQESDFCLLVIRSVPSVGSLDKQV